MPLTSKPPIVYDFEPVQSSSHPYS